MILEKPVPSSVATEVCKAREQRERAERETAELIEQRDQELAPLWRRLAFRRIENSFGRDYTITLEPRGKHS